MANDLTPTNPEASETWTRLSPGLRSLLTLGDRGSAIRSLAEMPVLLSEIRMSLPALRAEATRPAAMEGVQRVVGRRMALYPPMTKSEAAWAAWWQDYADALADLPEAALEAGMRAWIKAPESDFLPSPGRLRQLAQTATVMAITAYDRAKAAVGADPPPEVKPRASEEADQAMLADYRSKVAKAPQRPPPPPTHGRTDETGITAEMRVALTRAEGAP